MRELDAILARYGQLKNTGTESVLATVVHVEGSSYRRAGARMLVDEFGNITGAISGGCLEGDALQKALLALHQQKNKLVTYDTSDEDDAVIGAQLGCNGIIRVLIEPLDYKDKFNPCELLKKVVRQEKPMGIVVQFNLNRTKEQPGTILLVDQNGNFLGKELKKDLLDLILEQAQSTIKTKKPHFGAYYDDNQTHHLFVEPYQSPVKLILVGAGNDAQLLARQAELLGWEVVITDGRPTHANKERFSGSCQVVVSRPEETLEHISIDSQSCFVLMSHNFHYDLSVFKLLLGESKIPYIGMLGPLKKYDRMVAELKEEGMMISKENLQRVYAPVGLEIGAETPAEIGLAILAEIQSVLTEKSARPLRDKKTPIHQKKDTHFKQIQV